MTAAAPLTLLSAIVFAVVAIAAAWIARRRSWSAPAMIVASAPFAWYHQLGPTEITISKSAFVGAVIGIVWTLAADRDRRARAIVALRGSRALLPLVALALWSALSVFWAGTPDDAVRDALKWVWYAGVFALTAVSIEEPADGMKVLVAMFVTAAVVALDGLWQNATSAPAGFVAPGGAVVGRIAGTLEGPNQFGAYLVSAICPLLAVALFARLSGAATAAVSLLLGLLGADLVFTYSRGALWSCAVAVSAIAIAYVRSRRAGSPLPLAVPAAFVVGVVLIFVPVAHSAVGLSGWEHELLTPTASDTVDSAQRRVQLWTCAVELFAHHPVAGVGAGNFADSKEACGSALAGAEHFNANEWYLETAADLGTVGVAVLAAFLFALLSAGRVAQVWRDPVALGAYAVLIAFVLHGFVDDVMAYPKAALSFFVLTAMLPRPPSRRGETGRPRRPG